MGLGNAAEQRPSLWETIATDSSELRGNPEGASYLVQRFEGQYLPALRKARTQEQRERVWLAFWSYLTATISSRKLFRLSPGGADRLIGEFQKAMSEGPKCGEA